MVLGNDDPPFGDSFSKRGPVARIRRSLAQIDGIVAGSSHCVHGLSDNVEIGEQAHAIALRSSDLPQQLIR